MSIVRRLDTIYRNILSLQVVISQISRIRRKYKKHNLHKLLMPIRANILDSIVGKISFDQNVGRTRGLGVKQLSWQICGKFKHRSAEHCIVIR